MGVPFVLFPKRRRPSLIFPVFFLNALSSKGLFINGLDQSRLATYEDDVSALDVFPYELEEPADN